MKSRKLIFLFAAALMMALTYVTPAQAGGKTIWENPENPCNKLKFGGDVRFRYETASRSVAGTSEDRTRERIRVRLNIGYDTGKGATAGIRLATVPTANNTQNQTLEGTDAQGSPSAAAGAPSNIGMANFGIGRAFIKWKHGSGFWVVGGKFGSPVKQLSGTWLNGSFNPEGIALGYSAAVGDGKLKFALGQLMIDEKGRADEGDETAILATLDWGGNVGGIKLTAGFTNLAIDRTVASPGTVDDETYTLILVGAKMGAISGGIEYFTSDADTDGYANGKSSDAQGMTIHVRYKINAMLGIRVYMYDVGVAAAPVPTTDFAQYDNNFTGTKIQLDVKAGGVNMDFRVLNQAVKNEDLETWDDASMIQANFVVGF